MATFRLMETREIRFRPWPKRGELALDSPDGAYLQRRELRWQCVVVGPMLGSPGCYVDAMAEHLEKDLDLLEVEFMPPEHGLPPPSNPGRIGQAEMILRRGFVSIIVQERAPVARDYVVAASPKRRRKK